MRTLRDKLTYANVISTLCLFILLGGGAYAASQLPKNSVGAEADQERLHHWARRSRRGASSTSKTHARPPWRRSKGAKGRRAAAAPRPARATGTTRLGAAYGTRVGDSAKKSCFDRQPPPDSPPSSGSHATGIYLPDAGPGDDVAHPIASVDLGRIRRGSRRFVEPLADGRRRSAPPVELEISDLRAARQARALSTELPADSRRFTVFGPPAARIASPAMPKVELAGTELNYERAGAGEPLLLIQGMSANHLAWGRPFSSLLERELRRDRLRQPRHGALAARSPRPSRSPRWPPTRPACSTRWRSRAPTCWGSRWAG